MNYKIEGDFSPVLTILLSKNELLSAKVGSDGWFSPNICGISPAEDRLFSRKYTSCADNAEITLIPDVSPCTIYSAEVSESKPLLLAPSAFLAASGGAKLTSYMSKTFGKNRFELCEVSGSGTVFAQVCGNVIKRSLDENEVLIVRAGQLAACTKNCKVEAYESGNDIMLKVSGGEIVLMTAKNV